jgi:hypothetical protein
MSDVTYVDIYIEDHHSEEESDEPAQDSEDTGTEEDYDF